MNHQVKTIIAYFLILCVTVSIIPLNLLHHHDEDQIACEKGSADAENPCSQIVNFQAQSIDFECEHQTHLDSEQEHCEFCKLLTTRHFTYLPAPFEWLDPNHAVRENTLWIHSVSIISEPGDISNRGPPAA